MLKPSNRFFVAAIIFLVLTIGLNAFIIYQACLPGAESTGWSDPVTKVAADIVNDIKPDTINDSNIEDFSGVIRKLVGHFGLFGISGIFSSFAAYFMMTGGTKIKHYIQIIIALAFGLFIAALTEFIQYYVPGRSGEVLDSLIDFAGYFLGVMGIYLILLLIKNHKEKKVANAK